MFRVQNGSVSDVGHQVVDQSIQSFSGHVEVCIAYKIHMTWFEVILDKRQVEGQFLGYIIDVDYNFIVTDRGYKLNIQNTNCLVIVHNDLLCVVAL